MAWRGSPGQTLLVHSEQGLGDTIQFVRYVKLVKKRVGRVIVLTYRPLSKLFQDIQEIDEVVTDVDQLPNYDRHIAMMSLPHVLQTTQLSDHIQVPYLHATPDLVGLWRSRMETLSGFRVGIVWQGNREYSLGSRSKYSTELVQVASGDPWRTIGQSSERRMDANS